MSSKAPDPMAADTGIQEISELLEQVKVLTTKVERLQDGAVKEKLRDSLSELQSIANELKPERSR